MTDFSDFIDFEGVKPPPPAEAKYPHAPGYARGSDTSKAAAESMRGQATRLHKIIVAYLRGCGDRGATYTDIMAGCELGAPTVAGRMRELVVAGLVKDSGARRETPSGRKARVYIAVPDVDLK